MSNHLLGLHTLATLGDTVTWARQMAQAGSPFPVIKICDPQAERGALAAFRAASPKSKLMIRVSGQIENQATEHLETLSSSEAYQRGREMIDRLAAVLGDLAGQADIIEIVNEPDPPGEEGYARLGDLLIGAIQRADVVWPGKVLAMPALNNGTPQPEELLALLRAGLFEAMHRRGHIWTVHEGVDLGQPLSPIQTGATWLALRYRRTLDLLRPLGYTLPVIISEAYLGGGYSAGQAADVVAHYAWYEAECKKDSEVLAILPFTCGAHGEWTSQSYDALYPTPGGLMDYARSTPTPEEPPMPDAPIPTIYMRQPGDKVLLVFEPEPAPAPAEPPPAWPGELLAPFKARLAGPVDVRDAPDGKLIRQALAGTVLDVSEVRGGWWCVYRAGAREMWVPAPRLAAAE